MSSNKITSKQEKVQVVNDAVEDALLRSIGQIALKPRKHTQEQIDAINRDLAGLVTPANIPGIAARVHDYAESTLGMSRAFVSKQQEAKLQDQKLTWEQRVEHRMMLRKALGDAANDDHTSSTQAEIATQTPPNQTISSTSTLSNCGAPRHFLDAILAAEHKKGEISK